MKEERVRKIYYIDWVYPDIKKRKYAYYFRKIRLPKIIGVLLSIYQGRL